MRRVVLDTNIFVSALLSKNGTPTKIIDAWRERIFLVITCEAATLEIQRVLDELFATGKYAITKEQTESVIHLLRTDAIQVPGQMNVSGAIPQDPDDEKFLAIALEGEAEIIISGDNHLLNLGKYQNIIIQTARQFLDSPKSE